jgi:hypothetical protein
VCNEEKSQRAAAESLCSAAPKRRKSKWRGAGLVPFFWPREGAAVGSFWQRLLNGRLGEEQKMLRFFFAFFPRKRGGCRGRKGFIF